MAQLPQAEGRRRLCDLASASAVSSSMSYSAWQADPYRLSLPRRTHCLIVAWLTPSAIAASLVLTLRRWRVPSVVPLSCLLSSSQPLLRGPGMPGLAPYLQLVAASDAHPERSQAPRHDAIVQEHARQVPAELA